MALSSDREGTPRRGFGIYIHWPFCEAKCPYCDFNSHVAGGVDHARWRKALLRELHHGARDAPTRPVSSVFFGGGTPSLMEPDTVAALLRAVVDLWPVDGDLEVTLEANPSSVEAARFSAFAAAGVNRVSIGVQSLDDDALRFLGRVHDADTARRAVAVAARHFRRRSIDLIYARPGQTAAAWRRELNEALSMADGHLSAYQLTIEKGTAFYRQGVPAAEDEIALDLYAVTQEVLAGAGLPAYEVSNHARPGEACRHNLTYWRGGDYLGVGPGAHGRLTPGELTEAVRNLPNPEAWLKAVETRGHGAITRETLSPMARRDEVAMMGLRLHEGLRADLFRQATGMDLEAAFEPDRLFRLGEAGYLERDALGARVTPEGRLRLNAVVAYLLDSDGPPETGLTAH